MKNIGLIGCGHISETYFRSREYFNNINITACADLNLEAAKKCANEYNINAMSADDLLADKTIDVILNLTNPTAHYKTIKILSLQENTLIVKNHYQFNLIKEKN